MLQQMAKALQHTQLQNNLPGSKQASQGKCTKWDNYSAQWLGKGFGGLVWKKEVIEAIGTKENSKTKVFISNIRYWTRCYPAGTSHSLVNKKENRCLCNWSYSFILFFSWKQQSHSLPPQLSPAHVFLWAWKPWTYICNKSFSFRSVCSHTSARATTRQMLLQSQKKVTSHEEGG